MRDETLIDEILDFFTEFSDSKIDYLFKLTKLHAEDVSEEHSHTSCYSKPMFRRDHQRLLSRDFPQPGEVNYIYHVGFPIYRILLNNNVI